MDLFDALRILRRRWLVVVPLLVVVVVLTGFVYLSSTTVYTSQVSIGIAAASTTSAPAQANGQAVVTQQNGLINSGGTVLVANLLSIALDDATVQNAIQGQGGATYTTALALQGNSQQLPIVQVTATGPTAATVSSTLGLVTSRAGDELTTLQKNAGVPDNYAASAFPVQAASSPEASNPGKVRATAATGVAGLGLAVVIAVVVDSVLTRRAARRTGKAPWANGDAVRGRAGSGGGRRAARATHR